MALPSTEPMPVAGRPEAAAPISAAAARRGLAGDERLGPAPPLARQPPAAGAGRVTRRLQSRQRLGRLRQQLARIHPAPSCPQQAREEILDALARAGLGDWTVPELSDACVRRCSEGSICIPLLSHVIVLNPSGAFRIIDVYAGQHLYFEMPARTGRPFVLPADAIRRG
ncbi:hypothetical protein M8A51_18085 [Schlegelella sp. S2-27]|uniref:Uncharacterized protein n=1 Tax=Caldimonas mangrovi TaxID=2944811 RepID=A0ABT0YRU1_9BURK|nr:hypothetical protein [Caldimonas mangrovi]MCM5681441.1 hypothetical protein [Caldimonas mangrovi]